MLTGRLDDSLAVAALADGADEVMRRQDLCELSVAAMLGAASVRRAERLPPALGTDSQRFLNDFDTPVAVVDGHGGITAVNRAWWLVGRDGDATLPRVAPGVNYLAVCDSSTGPGSEGAAEVARGLRAVLRGDLEECSVTYQCSTPDIERWFTAHITPLGEVGGGAIIAHLEVSQLHLVETSLRRGIRLLPTVLISEPEVFTVLGPDGSAHHVAARTAELLGLPDETWQAGFLARAHPADRASAEALLATAADSTGTGSAVVRLLAADDRWHVLDVSVLDRSSDPRVGGLVLSGTDITEQRQAEITRRLQGRLIDRLPTAVIVNDEVGVVHSWNQRAVELYGYSAAEAVGRLAQDLLQVSLEDLAAANRPEARHPERLHGELLARHREGYEIPVLWTSEAIQDPAIGFSGHVVAALDVTEQHALMEDFVATAGRGDDDVTRSLADLFLDYGNGYLAAGPLAWSPGAVMLFLTDLVPRKVALDAEQRAGLPEALRRWLRFALARQGVAMEWIEPVVAEVDVSLPESEEAYDDESSWGPAKAVAAELAKREVDLTDREAVDDAIRALNAEQLARRLIRE